MESLVQEIETRTILGKKVSALRRSGMTPANIFGHGIESQAIKINTAEAEKILAKAGATHIITLRTPSSKEGRRVLVKNVQRNPITGELLHIDFYQVRMTDKVKVEVPIVFQGESPASQRKDLVLLENLRSVEVECLPDDIPESIAVDMSILAEAGDHISVGDLKLSDNITILKRAAEMIARVEIARAAVGEEVTGKKEMEEEEAAEETAEGSQD